MSPDPSAEGASAGPGVVAVLRRPNFLRLWIGSVTSALGAAVGGIVITWLIYSATRSAIALSVLGIVQFIPTLAFGLLAGALIDRLDRRRLMVSCDLARVACFGFLAVFVLIEGAAPGVLIGVTFAAAAFSTVFRPATNATIPRILGRDEVTEGNGLLQGGTTIAQFLGGPLGGVLLLTVGAVAGLAFNAVTFGVSAAMIVLMVIPSGSPSSESGTSPGRSLLADVAAGLAYLRSQRALFVITFTSMAANFFLSIWGGFTVVYAVQQLHVGVVGFAILGASSTAGFALGAILPGRLHTDRAPGRWILWSWGPMGFSVVALAIVSTLAAAVPLEFVGGLLLAMGNTTWLSGVQRTVPDEMLGRYFATDEAGSFAMIPAGLAVGGVVVAAFGISTALILAGVGTLVTNIFLVTSPEVRTWGRLAVSERRAG